MYIAASSTSTQSRNILRTPFRTPVAGPSKIPAGIHTSVCIRTILNAHFLFLLYLTSVDFTVTLPNWHMEIVTPTVTTPIHGRGRGGPSK